MDLRIVNRIRLGLVCAAMLLAFAGKCVDSPGGQTILIGLAVIALIAGFVVDFLYWRCPSCGAHLGRHAGDYCKWCGENLHK